MSAADLLKKAEIKTALIVDDGYDPVPEPTELLADGWLHFFDELTDAEQKVLEELFPGAGEKDEAELYSDKAFVLTIWQNRNRFAADTVAPVFSDYVAKQAETKLVLTDLETRLKNMGLNVTTCGSNFYSKALKVDLVFVDLYLGTTQSAADKEKSVKTMRKVIKKRGDRPPTIVLMSDSRHLTISKDSFRDGARVFESGFDVIKKREIKNDLKFLRMLRELARNRKDSLKLTKFVLAWREGQKEAAQETENEIRRLDLHDWAQITDLLLEAEGIGVGSYMLDVFDRVLQHNIEGQGKVITAAKTLDNLDDADYPPMASSASRDTLSILEKVIYQHPERRRIKALKGFPVEFGDVIKLKKGKRPKLGLFAGKKDTVYLVITPACDLVRCGASHVTFVQGACFNLDEDVAEPFGNSIRTSMLTLDGKRKVKVIWDSNSLTSLSLEEINAELSKDGSAEVTARLREHAASSLQQLILSNLGRIGTIAPIPMTFQAEVTFYFLNNNRDPIKLDVKNNDPVNAVCYVGRSSKKKEVRIPISPDAYIDIFNAVSSLDLTAVHQGSREHIKKIREASALELIISRGIEVELDSFTSKDWKLNGVKMGTLIYQRTIYEAFAANNRVVGLIIVLNSKAGSKIG